MELVSPLLDIFSRLYTCCAHCAHKTDYVRKLKQNIQTLDASFNKLICQRDDVNTKIEMAELNRAEKRTNVVSDWLQRVQILETEVQKILEDNKETKNGEGGCYFYCWGRKNCLSAYRLGKLVLQKQIAVDSLSTEGNFEDVSYRCQPDPVQEIATVEAVGMDAKFNEVMKLLVTEGNNVVVVGLYGMGGVGKTTLLHKVNNEFAETELFDLVIFVVVSKDLSIKSIQTEIGKKFGVSWTEETEIYGRATDIFKVLKRKKFLLLLDDIWEGIDLEIVGISKNSMQTTGSKVLFTTRSQQVCGSMDADERIKIECLNEDEAWSLFQEKAKGRALSCHPDVPEVAKKIAKECCGLPLALITIGRTMSSKTDLQQWQYALHTLQESASHFSGMTNKVLAILKFSYDNLETQKLKRCFIHCLLYPEDHSFYEDEIISLWVGEGFLDNNDDSVLSENEGHDVIRCLKDSCLLETGTQLGVKIKYMVKMHDVVRDLAIWVASDLGRKKGTYLTLQAESRLKLHEWEKVERISLINNKAMKLLTGTPYCSNLLTFFIKDSSISDISDDFFLLMPMLKVLNMIKVKLKKLPTSIFSLSELQFLDMPEYDEGVVLTPGSLASLKKIRILGLSQSCCHWEVEGGPSFCELESLQYLTGLKITIVTGAALQRLVTSPKLQLCKIFLTIKCCPGITSLTFLPSLPSSQVSSLSLSHMRILSIFTLKNCDELEELKIMSWDNVTSFRTVERLSLYSLPKLRIAWDVPQQSFFSVNLKCVVIKGCPRLRDITWLMYAQNLELLYLVELDGLEEIISTSFASEEQFSRLSCLDLRSLRNLKWICDDNVNFFHLEKIGVKKCPELKKLPFNTSSTIPRTLKMIQGEEQWWERLEWEEIATKSNLAPYFRYI